MASKELRLAHAYMHLGGVIAADLAMSPEVAFRAASANVVAYELRAGTLKRKDVDFHVKVVASTALTESRLYYNAGRSPAWRR